MEKGYSDRAVRFSMKILKLKIRPLLISFITLLIVPSLVFGAARGHGYLTIRGLKIDAQRLAEQGKYQEALERLSETDGKWTTQAVKNEIQKGKEIYKQLAESASNLAEGRERYYNGDYVGAIEFFKKVIPGDENYSSALKWLAVAEEKLKDDGQEVAGVSTELDDQVADLGQGAEPILEYPQINEPFTAFPSPLDLSWLFNSQITPRSFPQPTPSNSIAQQSYQSDPVVDQRRFLEDCNSDKESPK